MKAHQTGTFADWLLMVLKDCDQPVSVGCGTLTWHWAERAVVRMVLRSTSMNGMPANITTTMATNAVLDARSREHALVAFVGALRTGLQPFLHDDGNERQREYAARHQHGPDAVMDDPRTPASGSTPGSRW